MQYPPVTLLLGTYNCERFVAEATESAFRQDYPSLEILITDDASTDSTWEIVEQLVRNYRGPHSVVTNRNASNLYLEHFNSIWPKVRGEFCVLATHDDIYVPHRTRALIERHQSTGAAVVSSNAILIDELGTPSGLYRRDLDQLDLSLKAFARTGSNHVCFGTGMSWHRRVIDYFGPLRAGPRNADQVIPFRGALLGGLSYIEEPLLRWRQHRNNLTLTIQKRNATDDVERLLLDERTLGNRVANAMAMLQDLKHHVERVGADPEFNEVRLLLLSRMMEQLQHWLQIRFEMAQQHIGIR